MSGMYALCAVFTGFGDSVIQYPRYRGSTRDKISLKEVAILCLDAACCRHRRCLVAANASWPVAASDAGSFETALVSTFVENF